MGSHDGVIRKFYTAFANHDANAMAQCYHPEIVFDDPVFGTLKGREASNMWKMLLEKSQGKLKITFSDMKSDETSGSAKWIATYLFTKTGRQVVNHINAEFTFKDGLIARHSDHFDLWLWSRQAFGFKGWLLGWTGFMQGKIQQQAQASLKAYNQKQSAFKQKHYL